MSELSLQRCVEEQWQRMSVSERLESLEELAHIHLGRWLSMWGEVSSEALAHRSNVSDLPQSLRWRLVVSFRGMDVPSAASRSADLIIFSTEKGDVPVRVWRILKLRAIFVTIAARSDTVLPGNRTTSDLLDGELEEIGEELLSDGDIWGAKLPMILWPKREEQAEYKLLLNRMRDLPPFLLTRGEARVATERFNDGIPKDQLRDRLRRLIEIVAV